jgi:outer membrane receptor protein involved in Fe transport
VTQAPRAAGTAALAATEARRAPGTAGEPVRALADLPGVARAGFDSGELVVWGAASADTHVYLDGIELPALFHPGGFRALVHPALLDRFALTKAAPSPDYGRGLGGVVELDTREIDDATRAALDVNSMDSSAVLQGSLGPVRATWGVRAGYLDRLAPLLSSRAGEIVPLPAYADGFTKAQFELGQGSRLSATWLGSHDRLRRGIEAVDPASSRTQTQTRDLQLGYLRYTRIFADRARVTITPFVETHAHGEDSQSGEVPWGLRLHELRYGVRASYLLPAEHVDLELGVDSQALRSRVSRAGTLTLPPREGDIAVFGQAPGDEVAHDEFITYDANVAPHASVALHWAGLSLEPGLRLDVEALSTNRARPTLARTPSIGSAALQVRPEPRISVRYLVRDGLLLSARAGSAHQAPSAADRSALFGNPALGLARVWSVAAGPRVQLLPTVEVEATAFYRALTGLPARNPEQPTPLAQALLAEGTGKSYGAELSAIMHAGRDFSAQLSYTLSRATRRDIGAPERLFDFDQTHVLTALAEYRIAGFVLGGRARVASGSPRTAVVSVYRNLKDDRYEPIFGAHNAIRLPTFFALDLRIERVFVTPSVTWSIALDLINVTDHRNVEDLGYDFDYRRREDITGLPTLAVLGFRLQL